MTSVSTNQCNTTNGGYHKERLGLKITALTLNILFIVYWIIITPVYAIFLSPVLLVTLAVFSFTIIIAVIVINVICAVVTKNRISKILYIISASLVSFSFYTSTVLGIIGYHNFGFSIFLGIVQLAGVILAVVGTSLWMSSKCHYNYDSKPKEQRVINDSATNPYEKD